MKNLMRFIKNERGTETVEWAIMIGLIAVAIIALVIAIGNWVFAKFNTLNNSLQ